MSNPVIKKDLWTETLRPKRLESALIVPRIRQELQNGVIDNILLYGSPGAGKTTLTRILCQGHEFKEINASLERGIDTIRDVVTEFSCTASLFDDSGDNFKIIVLEECDNLTADAWKSLRAVMEKAHDNCRFIANCNYIEKIPEPILSRFNCISIDPISREEEDLLLNLYIERVVKIVSAMKMEYDEAAVRKLVTDTFPDMRSVIKKLQQMYNRGVGVTTTNVADTIKGAELFKMILEDWRNSPYDNYQKIAKEYSLKADDGVLEISKNFINYMHSTYPQYDSMIPWIITDIAEAVHRMSTALDKLIILEGLIYELQLRIAAFNGQQ